MLFKRKLRSCLRAALTKEVKVLGVKECPISDMVFCQILDEGKNARSVAEVRYPDNLETDLKPHKFWSGPRFRTRADAVAHLKAEVHESESEFPDVLFYLVGRVGHYIQPLEILNHPDDFYADLGVGMLKSQQDFAAEGNLQLLDELLSTGNGIDDQDWAGRTALHCAANAGQREIVEYLLRRGANATLKDRGGDTPLERASKKGYSSIEEALRCA